MEDSGPTFDEELRVETSSWREMFRTPLSLRRVRVDELALHIEQTCSMRLSEIINAFSVSAKPLRVVILYGRIGRCVVYVRSREEAERFLRAIRFSKTQRNASFPVIAKVQLTIGLILSYAFAGAAVVGHGGSVYFWALAPLLFGAFFLLARCGRNLLVGRDGVTLSRFGRRRFISYRDLERVSRFVGTTRRKNLSRVDTFFGVTLHLRRYTELSFAVGARDWLDQHVDEHAIGALERISEALTDWRAENPSDDLEMLHRGTRPTSEWLSALRKLGSPDEVAYRVAPVDRDALLRIAEDPVNLAPSRIAAALVLRERWTSEERVRLEESARTIADPRLRVAMGRVFENGADHDLENLFDDLDPIEDKIR